MSHEKDLAHDIAYLNGMMAGFQFGISGNEAGYALAISKLNSEIHEAKQARPEHHSAPSDAAPAGEHPHNDGLDEFRKPLGLDQVGFPQPDGSVKWVDVKSVRGDNRSNDITYELNRVEVDK